MQATFIATLLLLFSVQSVAGMEAMHDGPVIIGYGKHAQVDQDMTIPTGSTFNVVFNISKSAGKGQLNHQLDSLARFINMHVGAGIAEKNIHLAAIIHGKAELDLLNQPAYQTRFGKDADNPNLPLIKILLQHHVRIILCGQSAAYQNIHHADLAEGAEMALSAMTAFALLQQQGYSVNPF